MDLYSYAGTVLTVKADVDITNINGQEIGNAFYSYYPNGETDKTVVCFEMPDSDVELNSTKIVVPDPKPEPKPEPEPEASTYTLTVKGGTFTYNGGEAMTSASVPVDAEVKVTLNQSAVPEGMVFDLWAMDEASLLGNPAVAYNEESFTIRQAPWPRTASSPWKPSTGMPPSRASPAFWHCRHHRRGRCRHGGHRVAGLPHRHGAVREVFPAHAGRGCGGRTHA